MSCLTAAHAHQVAVGAEIACAHLGAGLKAAAAADDRAAEQIVFAVRRQDTHTLDAVLVAVERRDLGFVADLDAQLVGDFAPEQQLPEPAADGVNDRAGLEIHLCRSPAPAFRARNLIPVSCIQWTAALELSTRNVASS